MKKCPFCKNRINRYDGMHIYRCNKNMHIWNKKDVKYEFLSFNYPIISKKNILFNEYVVKVKSLPDIKKEYNINYKNVIFLLDYFGIKRRTSKGSSKQISVKKYKRTCLDKYGVDNVSKLKIVKEKKGNKNLNILKDKDKFNEILNMITNGEIDLSYRDMETSTKKEMKKIHNDYYHFWLNLNDEQKNLLMGKNELIETRITNCLDKFNISYLKRFIIGRKFFDIKINNILIDVNSDFWHANPSVYNERDKLKFPFKRVVALSMWNKDKRKKEIAESYGYKVIIIWESDIKNLNDENILNYMINILNL